MSIFRRTFIVRVILFLLVNFAWSTLCISQVSSPAIDQNVEAMITTARSLSLKDPEKERLYRAVLKRAPSDPRALFNLALLLQAKAHYAEAAQLYKKLLVNKPGDAIAHYNLANVLLMQDKQSDWQQAAWHLRQFLFYAGKEARVKKASRLLDKLERNLARLYASARHSHYTRSELTSMLNRILPDDDVRGASRYDGPRVPLMLKFAPQSAALTPEAKQQLDDVAAVLKIPALAGDRIQIEGYTDSHEHPDFKQRLRYARLRAENVRDYLIKVHHLNPTRFTTKAMADLEIISANNTSQGRAQNRRVELYNLGKGRKVREPVHP